MEAMLQVGFTAKQHPRRKESQCQCVHLGRPSFQPKRMRAGKLPQPSSMVSHCNGDCILHTAQGSTLQWACHRYHQRAVDHRSGVGVEGLDDPTSLRHSSLVRQENLRLVHLA